MILEGPPRGLAASGLGTLRGGECLPGPTRERPPSEGRFHRRSCRQKRVAVCQQIIRAAGLCASVPPSLCVCLSVPHLCVSVCLSLHLCVCLSLHLCVCVSVCPPHSHHLSPPIVVERRVCLVTLELAIQPTKFVLRITWEKHASLLKVVEELTKLYGCFFSEPKCPFLICSISQF